MYNTQLVTKNMYWVGASDRRISRFENMFPIEKGIAYNSYLILDEKTCLLDTVDKSISEIYIDNILYVLNGRKLDYLVINHMEPDHCANIERICELFPDVTLVGNNKTFTFLEQFYESDLTARYHVVKDKEELSLGERTLTFYLAPMVHWPEVMVTYVNEDKILFSADAFGTFGALDGNLFFDQVDDKEELVSEYRRYYINIVGKHGANVQNLFKKITELPINMICALHGPVFRETEDIEFIMDKYQKWSTYTPEEKGVVIVFASMYGNTELAMDIIASKLSERGVRNIKVFDVSQTDPSYIVAQLHRYSNAVFSAINYNAELYLGMSTLLQEAIMTNYQNRKISWVNNGSWAGKSLQMAQEIMAKGKKIETVGETLVLKSALKKEQLPELDALVEAIVASLENE